MSEYGSENVITYGNCMKLYQSIWCQRSLPASAENIRKKFSGIFKRYRKRPVSWNWLMHNRMSMSIKQRRNLEDCYRCVSKTLTSKHLRWKAFRLYLTARSYWLLLQSTLSQIFGWCPGYVTIQNSLIVNQCASFSDHFHLLFKWIRNGKPCISNCKLQRIITNIKKKLPKQKRQQKVQTDNSNNHVC